MKPLSLATLIVAFALSLPSMAAEIETATGSVTIDAVPSRIAVYDIAAIDTLDRLGIRPAGVPDKLYLPELADVAKNAEVVGTLFEPDLEALNALGPDLVIVGGRSSPQASATSRVAETIDMTIVGTDLIAVAEARLKAYGTLFGKETEAKAAKVELDAAVASARAAVSGKGTGLILMTNGPKVSAYGEASRFGWLHQTLGLPPAAKELDAGEAALHGEAISFEFIAKANPDWLIVLDRSSAIGAGEAGAKATLDNELVAATTAWKKGQVVYLPAADFYIAAGGVQATVRVLGAITAAFAKTG